MNKKSLSIAVLLSLVVILAIVPLAAAKNPPTEPSASLLFSGLEGASGSTIGPDGALYVTEGAAGRILRIDPETGNDTVFASNLPVRVIPLGGVVDVAFLDGTAYALVTMVSPDVFGLGSDVTGIYRIDGPTSATPIADIGLYNLTYPSESDVFIDSGVQYALETFRGGFLVTDGHHNRVLRVTLDGQVSAMIDFDNIVPTGLEVSGKTILMTEAGPNPHLPENGKVIAFGPEASSPDDTSQVASGAPLLVDVEYGLGRSLYALAQGDFPVGSDDGSPALPYTGSLVEVNPDGTFTTIIEGLNQPTSVDFIGNTAYVISLAGDIWKIENVSNPPFGQAK
jgi:hypothetical protein